MICKLIVVSLFFCCAISYSAKASSLEVPRKTNIDTSLINSPNPAINVKALKHIADPNAAPITSFNASSNSNLNSQKNYHSHRRREKIYAVAKNVQKIQAKVDKIEAQIRKIELQDQ